MDFLSHPRRSRSLGQIGSIGGHITDELLAYSRGIVKGTHEVDAMNEYYIRALIGVGCPAELILDAANTIRDFNTDNDALELYLPFYEASGTACADLSGNSNDGTATGTTVVDGVFGRMRHFDGTDDYIECADAASLDFGTANFSIEAWFNLTDQWYAQHPHIFSKQDPEQATEWALFVSSGDGYLTFRANATNQLEYAVDMADDTWHHVVVTRVSGVFHLYVDSVDRDNVTVALTLTNASVLRIGRRSAAYNGYFKGDIDEVRIYTRALSADEVSLHYLAGALKLGLI